MSLYDEADAGALAKLDEAEGRGWTIAEMDAMTDRLKRPRTRKPHPVTEQDRLDHEDRELCESEAAEEAKWDGIFAGQAEHWGGEVHWPESSGYDRRAFDVSGMRSVS